MQIQSGNIGPKQTNTGHHLLNLRIEPNFLNRNSAKRIRTSSSMHRACSHFPQTVVPGAAMVPVVIASRFKQQRDNAVHTTHRATMRKVHFAKEKRERSHNGLGIAGHIGPDDHRDPKKCHERKKESKNVSKTNRKKHSNKNMN